MAGRGAKRETSKVGRQYVILATSAIGVSYDPAKNVVQRD